MGDASRGRLIAISGLCGAGKTSVASLLADGGYWHRYSFTAGATDVVREILVKAGYGGSLLEQMMGGVLFRTSCPATGASPAQMIAVLMTRFADHGAIWQDLLAADVNRRLSMGRNVVVDDLETDEEASRVRRLGGLHLHVERAARVPPAMGEYAFWLEQLHACGVGPAFMRTRQQIGVDAIRHQLSHASTLDRDQERVPIVRTQQCMEWAERFVAECLFRDGHAPLTDQAAPSRTMSPAVIAQADIVVRNSGDLFALARAVEDVLASADLGMAERSGAASGMADLS